MLGSRVLEGRRRGVEDSPSRPAAESQVVPPKRWTPLRPKKDGEQRLAPVVQSRGDLYRVSSGTGRSSWRPGSRAYSSTTLPPTKCSSTMRSMASVVSPQYQMPSG